MNFRTIAQDEVPQGRHGKHHDVLVQLLHDIEKLPDDMALKVPLTDLPSSKANIRSALNRATRKLNLEVVTSSDDVYFYVWKPAPKKD